MIITSTKLIALLKPKITKVGKVAMRDLDFAVKMVNGKVWEIEELEDWADNFSHDPWRNKNPRYRTIAHFLREPDRWSEPTVEEAEEGQLL